MSLVLATLGVAWLALPIAPGRTSIVIWNTTASVPIGVYRVVAGKPRRGLTAVIRLPEPVRTFAHARAYLPATALLIKPIAALRGDIFCRQGHIVSINARVVAIARDMDDAGRALPRWHGCHRLDATRVAVIANRPDSFDSRYFGPVRSDDLVGFAIPLWTIGHLAPALQQESLARRSTSCSVAPAPDRPGSTLLQAACATN